MTLTRSILSVAMAKTMVQAAEQAALDNNIKIVIAIFDHAGNLFYFQRMDGTSVGSITVAQLKAQTSARFPITTKDLAKKSINIPGNPYASIPGFLLLGGGLPILTSNGQHLGGIGISGATPDLDELCAQHALNNIKSDLV